MNRRSFFQLLFGASVAAPICLLMKENPTAAAAIVPLAPKFAPTWFEIPPPPPGEYHRFRSRWIYPTLEEMREAHKKLPPEFLSGDFY